MKNAALWGPILFALRDFCLAGRALNGLIWLGGHDLDIHPHLPAIILNDAHISAMVATDSSWIERPLQWACVAQ